MAGLTTLVKGRKKRKKTKDATFRNSSFVCIIKDLPVPHGEVTEKVYSQN